MKKDEIVERLLEEKHITAKEAVVLLKNDDHNGITYIYKRNPYFNEPTTTPPPIWCEDNTTTT
jgi:hypothetical protein